MESLLNLLQIIYNNPAIPKICCRTTLRNCADVTHRAVFVNVVCSDEVSDEKFVSVERI